MPTPESSDARRVAAVFVRFSTVIGAEDSPETARDPRGFAVKLQYRQWVEGALGRCQMSRTLDDYRQAGDRYRTFEPWERDELVRNLGDDMRQCPERIALRMVWHFWHCDEDYGRRVAEAAGIDLEKAKVLAPLPGRAAPNQVMQFDAEIEAAK